MKKKLVLKKYLKTQYLYEFKCNPKIFNNLEQFSNAVDWSEYKSRIGSDKYKGGLSYFGNNNSLTNSKSLNELHSWLEKCIQGVKEDIELYKNNFIKLKISQSWLNCSFKGNVHHLHFHSLSILSGILYLTDPAFTIFCPNSLYSLPSLFPNKGKLENYTYKGKKGYLVIFPSSLKHFVGPHMSDKPRISFSFNTWFSGSVGDPQKLTYIPESLK